MTTIITLIVMTAVFSGAFYGLRHLWLWKKGPASANSTPDDLAAIYGSIPLRALMVLSGISGILAVGAGFAFLNLSYRAAPILQVRSLDEVDQRVVVHQLKMPKVLRSDFVESPKVRVIVDDSDPNLPPVEDLLRRCTPMEITYVTKEGQVKCYSEGSANAQKLLSATRYANHDIQQQGLGAIVAAATSEVSKEVANRKPADRYAELVYFALTFLGVFLRFCWEATQKRRRTKQSLYFTPQTLITSLVLAIATYAMIIQSGLAGSSDLLSFKTGIFAIYNGLLSTGLLKDLGTLRPGATPPTAPAV